ncbi:DVU_2496 family lipoprotein [Halodesulfovibrio sp.]|uniref:DVU_2496 family lipoprotein n=1 Tax=Halodesulfovibrio sp. TaxID=1912772 RepID=UPI0025BF452A|nr:DVU_2496 family lipoprotein [Halodesulfovibrio sp.]
MKHRSNLYLALLLSFFCGFTLLFPHQGLCAKVYTIGDSSYDIALAKGKPPVKLGPIQAENVPDIFPQSFLEKDGSYGGGKVYPSISAAQKGLKVLLQKGTLPEGLTWHIFELDATWEDDVYEISQSDYRLNKLRIVRSRATE